jgi:hypothetical protein
MELEDLKAAWKSLDSRVDEMQAAQIAMRQFMRADGARSATGRLLVAPIFELVTSCLTAIWAGDFLADNFANISRAPIYALPAVLLDALAIFTIWLSIRQIMMVSSLDYSHSVIETQRTIARLRTLRVRSTQFMMLMGLPLWIIFPLVAGQAVIGFDLIKEVSLPWILGNLAFGLVASAAIIFAAKRYGPQSLYFQKVNDIFAGSEIVRAQKLLAEVDRFESPQSS